MSRAEDNMYKLVDRIESIDTATKVSEVLLLEMGLIINTEDWRWSVYKELVAKINLLKMENSKK